MQWGDFQAQAVEPPKPVLVIPDDIKRLLDSKELPHDKDGVLMLQQQLKQQLDYYKETEMEVRKFSCTLLVEQPKEGVNNVHLGNGYVAKVTHKLNYTLDSDLDKVDEVYGLIENCGNEGAFIAERLIKWSADVSVTEYKQLIEDAKVSPVKKVILDLISKVLTVKEGAPSLEIKEPKKKG